MEQTKRNAVNQWYANTLHSRLNNRTEDVLIIVMQRLHLDDLCGFVQEKENWEVLNLPAIAKKDEEYELLSGEKVGRRAGEVLNKNLDTLESLKKVKDTIGEELFEAQYQQNPGIRRGIFENLKFTVKKDFWAYHLFQLWNLDLNNMSEPGNQVCITVTCKNDQDMHIIDIFQGRLGYSQLKKKMLEHQKAMGALRVLFEETKVSRVLMGELQAASPAYHWEFYEDDVAKMERLIINTEELASGRISVETKAMKQLLVKNLESYPHGGDLSVAEVLGMGLNHIQRQAKLDITCYPTEDLEYLGKVFIAIAQGIPFDEIDEFEKLDCALLQKTTANVRQMRNNTDA